MDPLDTVFAHLNRWRHLPAYQLERRADIFFSAYLPEVVTEVTGVPVFDRVIPELPIKHDDNRQSDKVDYALLAKDRSKVFLVELKTDLKSQRSEQKAYLCKAKGKKFGEIVQGIIDIVPGSAAPEKYAHLLHELQCLGVICAPEGFDSIHGSRPTSDLAQRLTVCSWVCKADVEVIYVLPKADVIGFEAFAKVVERHGDALSRRFAKSLRDWTTPAGSMPPPP